MVEERGCQGAQWHAVSPVASVRARVVEEIGVPSRDRRGEYRYGNQAREQPCDVQNKKEAPAEAGAVVGIWLREIGRVSRGQNEGLESEHFVGRHKVRLTSAGGRVLVGSSYQRNS